MKDIVIKGVGFRNFFSFGSVEKYFDFLKGIHLLAGENGSGKTTIFNAVRYGLFGVSDRKDELVLSDIINNINKKGLFVKVDFSVNDVDYIIERGMKPDIYKVYISGIEQDIDAKKKDYQKYFEESILGLTDELFVKMVSIDGDYDSFFTAKKKDREKFINNFIDFDMIDVWKDKNSKLNNEISHSKTEIEGINKGLTFTLNGLITDAKKIKEDDSKDVLIEGKVKKFNDIEGVITQHLTEHDLIKSDIGDFIQIDPKNLTVCEEMITDLNKKTSNLNTEITKHESEFKSCNGYIKDMQNMDFDVDSCKEEIAVRIEEETQRANEVQEQLTNFHTELNGLTAQKRNLSAYADALDSLRDEFSALERKLETNKTEYVTLMENKGILQEDIDSLKKKAEDDKTDKLDKIKEKVDEVHDKIKKNDAEIALYDLDMDHSNKLRNILNKRVKGYFISKIKPFLNSKMLHYANALKTPCVVQFTSDDLTDTVFKSIEQRNFKYGNLSKGQRKVLDLSLLLSFRDLFSLNRGVTCNLFIFDEFFSAVSEVVFLTIIESLQDVRPEASINVTLHNKSALEQVKCDRYIQFEHDGMFSNMKVLE